MFSFTSWISDARGADKVLDAQFQDKMAPSSQPVVEILPHGAGCKRKRSLGGGETVDLQPQTTTQALKRQKICLLGGDANALDSANQLPNVKPKKTVKRDPSRVRETIESHFGLEILLKHKELRLINQELAKCQVALEQLRRCHLIPYPTAQSTVESMMDVTNGTGPSLRQGSKVPQWAPSFGVADGPYTRHYSRWLIPDPTFDGVQPEWQREASRAGKSIPEGRSTRYSFGDGMLLSGKSRSQRGSQGQKLQALSSGYPVEKAKVGPCVLKRSDGQTVKLVCVDCNRENFSSTQGFINHCRIAHKREFKSHEEAAVISGQPYEVEETSTTLPEEKAAPAVAPPPPTPVATGLVHPLVRSAPTDPDAYKNLLSRIHSSVAMFEQGKHPNASSIPSSTTTTPIKPQPRSVADFVPSKDAPRLSELFHSKGLNGDFSKMISEAKTKIDFDDISSQDGDSESESHPSPRSHLSAIEPETPLHVMRVPARATMSPAPNRPGSSKGMDLKSSRMGMPGISPRLSHATPVIDTAAMHLNRPGRVINDLRAGEYGSIGGDIDLEMMDGPSVTELSPNTVASNNAPSLVSDDGEYEDGDDADSATSGDDDDSVAEIDIEDDGLDKVSANVLRNRTGSGGVGGMGMRKEDKHVTFMSPVKDGKQIVRRK